MTQTLHTALLVLLDHDSPPPTHARHHKTLEHPLLSPSLPPLLLLQQHRAGSRAVGAFRSSQLLRRHITSAFSARECPKVSRCWGACELAGSASDALPAATKSSAFDRRHTLFFPPLLPEPSGFFHVGLSQVPVRGVSP